MPPRRTTLSLPASLDVAHVKRLFLSTVPNVEFASLRWHVDDVERIGVRRDKPRLPALTADVGAAVTVHHRRGTGFCATSDVSRSGLRHAFATALSWAQFSGDGAVPNCAPVEPAGNSRYFRSSIRERWEDRSLP